MGGQGNVACCFQRNGGKLRLSTGKIPDGGRTFAAASQRGKHTGTVIRIMGFGDGILDPSPQPKRKAYPGVTGASGCSGKMRKRQKRGNEIPRESCRLLPKAALPSKKGSDCGRKRKREPLIQKCQDHTKGGGGTEPIVGVPS